MRQGRRTRRRGLFREREEKVCLRERVEGDFGGRERGPLLRRNMPVVKTGRERALKVPLGGMWGEGGVTKPKLCRIGGRESRSKRGKARLGGERREKRSSRGGCRKDRIENEMSGQHSIKTAAIGRAKETVREFCLRVRERHHKGGIIIADKKRKCLPGAAPAREKVGKMKGGNVFDHRGGSRKTKRGSGSNHHWPRKREKRQPEKNVVLQQMECDRERKPKVGKEG